MNPFFITFLVYRSVSRITLDFWLFSEFRGLMGRAPQLWQPTSLMFTKKGADWACTIWIYADLSHHKISDFVMFNLQLLVCWWFNYGGRWVQHVQYAVNRALKGKYCWNATAYGNQVPEQCLHDLGTNISISRILKVFIKVHDIGVWCTLYLLIYIYMSLISLYIIYKWYMYHDAAS